MMKIIMMLATIASVPVIWGTIVAAGSLPAPTNLRVDGLLQEVAVISTAKPRFSFLHGPVISPGTYGITQQSYRIVVTDRDTHSLYWDSGFVATSKSNLIEYAGLKPLQPFTRYQWTVEWNDSQGRGVSDQAVSNFETGPMTDADWTSHNASWFNEYQNQYRFEFAVPDNADISWARAYIASPGCHVLEVNGLVPVPDLLGICPWVAGDPQRNSRYQTHDISAMVTPGWNAVGVLAGHVMTSKPQFTAVLKIQLGSGTTLWFSTGSPGWMSRASYVTSDSAWATTIDWTRRESGWSSPNFKPSSLWANVTSTPGDAPARALSMPVTTVLDQVKPISVTNLPDGSFLYKFPKNFVGTVQVNPLPGATSGSYLSMLSGEWLESSAPKPPVPPPGPPGKCALVNENDVAKIACPPGITIDGVSFASFGTPNGNCTDGFTVNPSCNDANSTQVVQKMCVDKTSCDISATDTMFGDPCTGTVKLLAVKVHCKGDPPSPPPAPAPSPPPAPPPPAPENPTYPHISGGQQQYENHVLMAGNPEPITTVFCWHGFQYVRVFSTGHTGFAGGLNDIIGLELHTNVSSTGDLAFGGDGVSGSSSDRAAQVLNGILSMTLQSQRTNIAAYMPTDCPTREKHGWMGDALDASEQALYNFDMLAIHESFMQLIQDNQGVDGDVPVVIPNGFPGSSSCNDIAWTSAYPQITNMLFKYYDDITVVQKHWPSLVNYTENLISHATNGLAECDQFKDWLCGNAQSCCSGSPKGSDCPVPQEMGGFNYVLGLEAMANMATVLGLEQNSSRYKSLAETGTSEFHKEFYNPTFQRYGGDMGAVQSLTTPALTINSVPDQLQQTIIQSLQNDLANVTGYTPHVGAVTSKILLNVLSDNGLHETALKVATTTAEPSWGWWWTQNATTCWESFPGGGATRNHIFLCGGIGEWMWKSLVGLKPIASGFSSVSIAPKVNPALGPSMLRATYLSPAGAISVDWELVLSKTTASLHASLPVGVSSGVIAVPFPFRTAPAPTTTSCYSTTEASKTLTLTCSTPGATVKSIDFATFGTPNVGQPCQDWTVNASCASNTSAVINYVEKLCLGKDSCIVPLETGGSTFGPDPCKNIVKTLAVRATCTGGTSAIQLSEAQISEGGTIVWNGTALVGSHPGIRSAIVSENAVAFNVVNGKFDFIASPLAM